MKFQIVEAKFPNAFFQKYFQQIKTKTFQPITDKIYETIQLEGIDEEQGVFNKENFSFIELDIPSIDKEKLKLFDDITIEKYNQFDIILKDTFSNFIDYDKGEIKIIKIK